MTSLFPKLKFSFCLIAFFSSVFQAFGMYNIHALSGVTEGGVLGLTLLLDHWFRISPAISGFVLNAVCYLIGWRTLGKDFIAYSVIAAAGFSVGYGICEQFPPLWPGSPSIPCWRLSWEPCSSVSAQASAFGWAAPPRATMPLP